jgi:hypothetical protein
MSNQILMISLQNIEPDNTPLAKVIFFCPAVFVGLPICNYHYNSCVTANNSLLVCQNLLLEKNLKMLFTI